jgi:hypothetical protein
MLRRWNARVVDSFFDVSHDTLCTSTFYMLASSGLDGPAHSYFAHHSLGFDRAQAGPIPCTMPISNFTELVSEVKYRRKGTMRL